MSKKDLKTQYLLKNILADRELNRNSVCAKFAHTTVDGNLFLNHIKEKEVMVALTTNLLV